MVRIDGAKARRIREQNGLTQLYVATVVQVTTDTISRWENRRYPTIKKDNAEKLAEALGVELSALLDETEVAVEGEAGVSAPEPATIEAEVSIAARKASIRSRWLWLGALILLLVGAGLGWLLFYGSAGDSPRISAFRILPGHVPPGQSFPVLIRINADPAASFALIIREQLPPGCLVLAAIPVPAMAGRQDGQLKWVSRLEGGERLISYLLASPAAAVYGQELSFQGQALPGRGGAATAIEGGDQLEIGRHHWADINGDNHIDDEEILVVYDLFGEVDSFAGLRDEVDTIWAAGGYRWDEVGRKYLLEQ
jgi:transcriptional regulator with XRE-family HTH domain